MIDKANLTTEEIQRLIAEKELEMEESFAPEFFVLTDRYRKLQNEIHELQKQCPHEVKDGYCVYCHIPEELIEW